MAVIFTQPIASHGGLNWDTNLEAALTELKTKANRADQGISGADLNQITEAGDYYGSSLANAPLGSANGFLVHHFVRPDGAAQAQLAINVNSDGAVFVRRYSTTWQPWQRLVSGPDDGWVTSSTGITAATGFTLTSARYRLSGKVVSIGIVLTRTGSAITAPASGIITPVQVAALPAALIPPQANGAWVNNGSGATVSGGGYFSSATGVTLSYLGGSQSLAATTGVLDLMGTYLI